MKEKGMLLWSCCILALTGCGKPGDSTSNSNNSTGNPVTAPVDYLGAVNKAQKAAVRTVDLAALKNAIQLFHAQEDRFPKDLNELAQKRYIQEVPSAPAGSRFSYNPQSGEIRLVRE